MNSACQLQTLPSSPWHLYFKCNQEPCQKAKLPTLNAAGVALEGFPNPAPQRKGCGNRFGPFLSSMVMIPSLNSTENFLGLFFFLVF